jgi:histidinol-phosphatase (PHP family)
VLALLARSGRALEINTRVPLPATIVRWWHEAGGEAVAFGIDAHQPSAIARGSPKPPPRPKQPTSTPAAIRTTFWLR